MSSLLGMFLTPLLAGLPPHSLGNFSPKEFAVAACLVPFGAPFVQETEKRWCGRDKPLEELGRS
jgi:hypothetical protein